MSNGFDNGDQAAIEQLKCSGCGAILKFKPGTKNLKCTHCGAENVIADSAEVIEEIDFEKFMKQSYSAEDKVEVTAVKCNACGASITLQPNVTADQCPYCASNIVVKSGSTSKLLKPKSLLPFKIEKDSAAESFRNWMHKLWFAPSDLKSKAEKGKMEGIYVPYWTYDANTQSWYTGERGVYYYETESYTTTENGKTVTKTRQVRKTHWTPVSGHVYNNFDDVLVVASHSLPRKYTDRLEPWNLKELLPYNDQYLSGFRSETYQIDVAEGFEEAKGKMQPVIQNTIRHDIGSNEQRIHSVKTRYDDVTFKHTLLPVWISSYRYRDKVYRFVINGQTGKVKGERPYSVIKILIAVIVAIAIIVAAILIFGKK